jgi:hypothetical protein
MVSSPDMSQLVNQNATDVGRPVVIGKTTGPNEL